MKKFILFVFITVLFLVPSQAQAHMIGQQPYFKVNRVFTDLYPVPTTSLGDFELPQDIVKTSFLVNETIDFEIDKAALPVPIEVVEKTKFIWEFGDGTNGEGLKNQHAFSEPRTYIINIYADSEGGFEKQLLQSTAINIVPDKNYKLPRAVIEINGKQSKDPLLDILDVNFNSEIKFRGSESDGGSSEISEYTWDLGDQSSRKEKDFSYKYTENPYTVFPVLRIKTTDGFIADAFVQIKDEDAFEESEPGIDWMLIIGAVLMSLILAGILTWLISKFLLKK